MPSWGPSWSGWRASSICAIEAPAKARSRGDESRAIEHLVHRFTGLGMVDRALFLSGRPGGRKLLPGGAHRPVRQARGSASRTSGLRDRVPLRGAERHVAERGSREAAAVLAHVDRKQHVPAHAQVLVADVHWFVGAPHLRVVHLSVLSGNPRGGRPAFARGFGGSEPQPVARPAHDRRPVARVARTARAVGARPRDFGDRGDLWSLYRRLYRGAAGGDQPSDLVRHAAAGYALRGLGHIDGGSADYPAGAPIPLDDAGSCGPASHG